MSVANVLPEAAEKWDASDTGVENTDVTVVRGGVMGSSESVLVSKSTAPLPSLHTSQVKASS